MATKVVMEALSPTMEEGRLVEWKKQVGDTVAAGDVLAEVETDKAVMELVARAPGTLLKQVVAAGQTVPVSEVVGWIGAAGEEVGEGVRADRADRADKTDREEVADRTRPAGADPGAGGKPAGGAVEVAGGRIKASPLARRIAAAEGVDLAAVRGTGPDGRIIKRDLATAPATAASSATARPAVPMERLGDGFEDVAVSPMRKTIARRLVQSLGPIPTFYLTAEVDMERAWEARAALNEVSGDRGKASFNDIIVKATATALREHPACNAWWQEGSIRQWHEVHLGMAVAVPDGLITPVIRHADRKTLRQISAEARDLAGRARDRKLQPDEYTGATFTISNLGMFDIHEFTALINPPEAGILAVGRIAQVPAVVGGAIVPRRRMMLTMSCDHRVIDGATGAAFLRTLTLMLENPLALVW